MNTALYLPSMQLIISLFPKKVFVELELENLHHKRLARKLNLFYKFLQNTVLNQIPSLISSIELLQCKQLYKLLFILALSILKTVLNYKFFCHEASYYSLTLTDRFNIVKALKCFFIRNVILHFSQHLYLALLTTPNLSLKDQTCLGWVYFKHYTKQKWRGSCGFRQLSQ